MAITDYKVTPGEVDTNAVEAAPDTLSDTANNNKKRFDQLIKVVINKYNDLIDYIESSIITEDNIGAGLVLDDDLHWRYALEKGDSMGVNFSGTITQITTGYRTTVGEISGLTSDDFMDCFLEINSNLYECGDSWESGGTVYTECIVNDVPIEIRYANGDDIILEHATNPLDTTYWNVKLYKSVAEKVPKKVFPATVIGGDMTKAEYDTDHNGKVDHAELADTATNADNATKLDNVSASTYMKQSTQINPTSIIIGSDTSTSQMGATVGSIAGVTSNSGYSRYFNNVGWVYPSGSTGSDNPMSMTLGAGTYVITGEVNVTGMTGDVYGIAICRYESGDWSIYARSQDVGDVGANARFCTTLLVRITENTTFRVAVYNGQTCTVSDLVMEAVRIA